MELVQHHCRNCGGALLPHSEEKLKCQNCGTLYDVQSAEKHTRQMRELFDEAKQELINNLRRNLYNAVNAEYISSTEVQGICTSLKQYLPDDFQANFYEIATGTNVRRISQAIRAIDVNANYDDLDGIIRYLIRSLQSEYLLELNNLVERAYKQRDLQKFEEYCTAISDEAEKVQLGVYETKLPREVFVAYSSKDMDKVSELVSVLEAQGLKCFVAARNLRHGKGAVENYNRALEEAMDHCRSFVFVSSCNSRNINCDALEIEIPYVEGKDIENSPAQYRNNYQSIPTQFKKPRVEYRIEESRGFNAADSITNKFFDGYERVYSPEEVAKRVMTQLVAAQGSETEGEEKKYCDACGHENTADAKFCIECGNRGFVASVAEFIQLSKKKQDQIQRDAARRVEEAQKASKAGSKKSGSKPPKRKLGCFIGFLITVVILGVIGIIGSVVERTGSSNVPTPNHIYTIGGFDTDMNISIGNGNFDNDYEDKEDRPGADETDRVVHDSLVYVNQDGDGWYVSAESGAQNTLSGELVIPDSVEGIPVIGISDYAFRNCRKLTAVTVPDSVKVIGLGAFNACSGLGEIQLPFVGRSEESTDYFETSFGYIFGTDYYSNAVNVEGWSGTYCIPAALSSVTLNGAEWIENYAFRNCTMLKTVTLGDSMTRIGAYAFENCTALTEFTLPGSVTEIPEQMFRGCTALSRVRFDADTLTSIAPYAFYNCVSLEGFNDSEVGHFVLPDTLASIGEGAFSACLKMTHLSVPFLGTQENAMGRSALFGIVFGEEWYNGGLSYEQHYDNGNGYANFCIPQNLTSVSVTKAAQIPAYAFENCSFLTEIALGSTVTSVGAYAFSGCTELENISLPAVAEISEGMLRNCSSLTSFFICESATSIGPYAFLGCYGLEFLGSEAVFLELDTFFGGEWTENAFVVPDTVKTIGEAAFNGCSQMTALSIPFVGSAPKAKEFEGTFGYIFGNGSYTDGIETVVQGYVCHLPASLRTVAVTSATQIPAYAFNNCSRLQTIYLSDAVKTVGKYAFDGCNGLTELSIPSLTAISEGMLKNCSSLKHFEIAATVTDIGPEAFRGCTSLASVNSENAGEFIIPSTVKTVGRAAFNGCVLMKDLTIPFVGYSASSEYPDGLFGYIFGIDFYSGGEEVDQIHSLYYIPTALETVTVTNAQKIVEHAFRNCTMLDYIYINADAAANVHSNAFSDNCSAEIVYR